MTMRGMIQVIGPNRSHHSEQFDTHSRNDVTHGDHAEKELYIPGIVQNIQGCINLVHLDNLEGKTTLHF